MDFDTLFGILLGASVLIFIILAVSRGELSNLESAKYEMLDMSPPDKAVERKSGRIGIEDRIIRLGLVGAAFYYASRFGWSNLLGISLGILGSYLLLTGLFGRDPIYMLRGWDTRMSDQ
jgi:hypothetical protein